MLTWFEHPEELTATKYDVLRTAFNYRFLVDGACLVSIKSPHGYLYWHNDQRDFEKCVHTMLSDLNIKKIEK